MELFEVFAKRHSYRSTFTDQAVSSEDLRKIVEAGLAAPSGKNCQTTEFVIINDAQLLSEISSMPQANKAMQQAKAYIACIVDKEPEPVFADLSFQIEDCAAAVENMLLAITALGYASVWIDGWIRAEQRNEKIGEMIKLPAGKIVRIILPIGVAAKEKSQPPKMDFDQRSWFNSYKVTS